ADEEPKRPGERRAGPRQRQPGGGGERERRLLVGRRRICAGEGRAKAAVAQHIGDENERHGQRHQAVGRRPELARQDRQDQELSAELGDVDDAERERPEEGPALAHARRLRRPRGGGSHAPAKAAPNAANISTVPKSKVIRSTLSNGVRTSW